MSDVKKLLVTVGLLVMLANAAFAQAPALRSLRPTSLESEGFRGAVFTAPAADPGIVQADHVEAVAPEATNPTAAVQPEEFVFGANSCVLPWKFWGGAEVLLGVSRPVPVVPVVTTGPAAAGVLNAGAIGQPGTVPLFGGRHMLGDWRGGLRAEGGMWFNDAQSTGVVGRFYSLYSTSDQLVGAGNGTNVVNVPQFVSFGNLVVQVPAPVGFPGISTGTVSTTAQTMFAGGDLNLRRRLRQTRHWQFDALAGYRQLYLHDELGADFTVVGALPAPLLAVASGGENIRTQNHFFGPNVGLVASTIGKRWSVEMFGAVALGVNVSDLDFKRNLIATVTGLPRTPLILTDAHDPMTYFGTVAEGGFKLGFRVREHARLTFGYSGLYWNNVRRAQEQLTLSPTLTGNTTYYFAHMLSCGAELRY